MAVISGLGIFYRLLSFPLRVERRSGRPASPGAGCGSMPRQFKRDAERRNDGKLSSVSETGYSAKALE